MTTSFDGHDLAAQCLALLFDVSAVTLDVPQFPLDSFAQLVQFLRLLLQLIHLVLFRLTTTTTTQSQTHRPGGSLAEWLACWTQARKARVQIAAATLSGNSLRQTVHTHRASVYQAAKLVAALLRVAGVKAGLAESNGSLLPGL